MKMDRLSLIKKYVLQKDFASIDELCQISNRSKNTIRRDINELAAAGVLEKVYGGVKATKKQNLSLLSFSERNEKNVREKQHIGELAAKLICDGDIIFIDSGTTTVNILDHLSHLSTVTVITNNLYVFVKCLERPNINIIALGGQLNRTTASFSSHFCFLENIERFNINKVFMAATSVSIEKGATHNSPEEFIIKKHLVEKGDTRYLLVDHSKFDQSALLTYAELTDFHSIITDRTPPEPYVNFFAEHNIQLLIK